MRDAATLGLAAGLLMFFPDREDGSGSLFAGLGVFAATAFALVAVRRVRPLPRRSAAEHWRLMLAALGVGIAVGLANLLSNFAMASLDPSIREQMVTRWAEFSTWSVVFAEPILEEIFYRLVLVSCLAWLVSRFTRDGRKVQWIALGIAAVLFGVAHIFYGGVESLWYAIGMAVKSSAAGLVFGLVFWRWGLPQSMLAHCAANGVHSLLMPYLF